MPGAGRGIPDEEEVPAEPAELYIPCILAAWLSHVGRRQSKRMKPEAAARWKNSVGNHPGREAGVRKAEGSGHSPVPSQDCISAGGGPAGRAAPAPSTAGPARQRRGQGAQGSAPGSRPAPTAGFGLGRSGRGRTLPGDVPRLVPEPHLEVLPGLLQPRGDPRRWRLLLLHVLAPRLAAARLRPRGAAEATGELREGDGPVAVAVEALEDGLGLGRPHPELGAESSEVLPLDAARAAGVARQKEGAQAGQLVPRRLGIHRQAPERGDSERGQKAMGAGGRLPYLRLSGAGRALLRPGSPRGRARPGGGTQVAAGRGRSRAGPPAPPGERGGPGPAAAALPQGLWGLGVPVEPSELRTAQVATDSKAG